ncbi:MAG: hypothetical protein ACOX6O_02185 [Christensenellales bacterium]
MKYRILYHAEAQESLLIAPEDCKIRKLKQGKTLNKLNECVRVQAGPHKTRETTEDLPESGGKLTAAEV